ncbi:MAG TPA: type II secretion system F family protein [Chloroflexota bacterium]|nr:type II secretion system F family protein [Chloroflexota bacterium]
MTGLSLPFDPRALEARALLWPLLFGLGLYLLVTAQPIGRPKPDLAERLRRLDVDERIQAELGRPAVRPIFASRLLEVMLRPVLDDLGRALQALLARVGLAGGRELERRLRVARPGVEPAQFFGEKVVTGLIGLVLFPLMNWLGVHPFGVWPLWAWAAGFAVGFLGPDWQLEQALAVRRTRCLMELPTILDMLTIATSAGLALEQALAQVARQSAGLVATELRYASREMALSQRSVVEALEAMAERNAVPELTSFAGQVRAAYDQGIPLVHTLQLQAEALREQKRLRIVEEGGKATVRMILPVALFILPVLFVVLLAPAAVELMHLGE